MIVEQGPEDRAAVERILTARIDQAMFPLTNLRDHGLAHGDFPSDHSHATRVWRIGNASLVALTRGGMLMALLDPGCDLSRLPAALAGLLVQGAVGPALSIRPVLRSLGLEGTAARLDEDEPGFALELARLRMPDQSRATLVPASTVPRDLLVRWRAAATVETQGMPPSEALDRAADDVDGWLERDTHRVLLLAERPVALSGFNADLSEIVQVGGVYTPIELRNHGYARTAVALQLAEARGRGCSRAVLFAATPAAVRAYLAIGFQPAADFALVLYDQPKTIVP